MALTENKNLLPAAAIVLLLLFAASSTAREVIGPMIKVFTEGNSAAKHYGFLGFLALFFVCRAAITSNKSSISTKIEAMLPASRKLFAAFVISGFALSLGAQLYFQHHYGLTAASYAAHVTDCSGSTCWEATYFQHVHVLKGAIYFAEKNTGFSLGSWTDNGEPMYEVAPHADAIALATIIVLLGIFGSALALSAERSNGRALLAAMAGIVSGMAVLDGGMFSLAGATGVTLVVLYFLGPEKIGKTGIENPAIALLAGAFLSFFAYIFLGTGLYFKEAMVAPFLVCAAHLLNGQWQLGKIRRLAAGAVLAAAIAITVFTAFPPAQAHTGKEAGERLAVYGLPAGIPASSVDSALGLSGGEKYGWYYIAQSNGTDANEAEKILRATFKPPGYLFAETDQGTAMQRGLRIIWKTNTAALDFDTASFTPSFALVEEGQETRTKGTALLNGPRLALEVASYVKAGGGDALIVSEVV